VYLLLLYVFALMALVRNLQALRSLLRLIRRMAELSFAYPPTQRSFYGEVETTRRSRLPSQSKKAKTQALKDGSDKAWHVEGARPEQKALRRHQDR
jgi:hypothetical protein